MVYTSVLFLHVLSAVIWIGGNILFFAVAPRLRTHPEGGPFALRVLGRTFRVLSWMAFAILLTTGAYFLSQGWDYRTWPLSLKLVLVGIVLVFKSLHDFWIAPAAAQKRGGFFTVALWIGRTNLLLGIVILYLSVWIRG
ncbi:MAG: hypothetical protein U9R33_02055 [candidate division NC10 bacterium]|nr:hypothetical protein [candidate division NC10 bacterium]